MNTKTRLLGSAATSAAIIFAGPAFAASGNIDLLALSAISNASLAITSPQNNTASVTATTSLTGGGAVLIGLNAYTTTANDTATGTFGISDNAASATATGNTTTSPNGNLLQINVLPTFVDSAAVTSLQSNTGAVAANSTDVNIAATIADSGATVHELQGTLTVDGNTVSTAGTANNAVNTIRIADAVSVVPVGGSPVSGASGGTGAASTVSNVTADLLVNSAQVSTTGDTTATTSGTVIAATVESVDVSTVLLEDNRIAATARGNQSANTVDTGDNAAILDMSVAVANFQRLSASDATATVSGSTLAIAAGTSIATFGVDNSTIAIDSNTISAAATANSTTQTLNLSANDVTGYGVPVTLSADGIATGAAVAVTNASAVISNAQDRADSDAIATNTAGAVTLTATSVLAGAAGDSIVDSTLSVTTNMAEAVAVGNNASGSMLLDGNTVSGGAGIVSAQASDAASTTTASVLANTMTLNPLDDLATSTAELTGNTQRAIAAGNIVSSALTVDTNEVDLVSVGGATVAVTDLGDATVTTNFAVATLQSQLGNVTAEALNGGFSIIAADDVAAASTVANDANTRVAAAYGNDASSRVSIDATVIAAAGPIGVAGAASQQELSAAVLARANGDSVVTTNINDLVQDSSVSTSLNTVEALAMGNRTTTSSVMVDATTINTLSGLVSQPAFYDGTSAVGQAAFNSVSAQVADGSVTASLRSGDGLDSSWIETYVGDDVSNSSITSELNTLRASATANAGVTGVALDATNVNTSSSVINAQISSSDVSALLGVAGLGPTAGGAYSFTVSLVGAANYDIPTSTITAGTFQVDGAGLSTAELNHLTGVLGYALSSGTLYQKSAAGTSATPVQFAALIGGVADSGTVPASAGTPNEGGVTLTVLGDITDSTLSVLSNLTSGSVTGNAATNTTSVSGTNIGAGSTTTIGVVDDANTSATAAFALSNTQNLTGAGTDLQSEVFGTFAIATDLSISEDVDTSTIQIEGNTQAASATGNTATNTTSLSASNISTTAALTSEQIVADVDMDARSNLEVFAEASDIQNSALSVSTNRNQSVAVTNDATNTLMATGANVTTAAAGLAAIGNSNTISGQADFALLGVQGSGGAVDSVAETLIYNQDLVSTATGNIATSTVAFDSNVSIAEATANRGTNRMVLGDGASLTSTGLVYGNQVSTTVVTATVDSDVTVAVLSSGITAPAATGSTLSVDGNAATAMARGNVGSNSLTASASQITDPTDTTATATGNVTALVDASNVVLSYQSQAANVDANAIGDFGLSLNDDTATTAVATTGSSISVSGNLVSSMGVANVVTNSASLSGTTIDTTSAVANGQLSTAALISADTDMTVSTVSTSTGSTIDMSSNAARAVAVANDATNSSVVAGTNIDFTGVAGNASIDAVAGTGSSTFGVGNVQASTGTTVQADVSLNADNQENGFASTLGVATGTVSFDSNSALAEASSNRATNSLTLNGDASMGATGTVTNAQLNTANATANATSDVRMGLETGIAGTGPVVSASTMSVDGNTTTALARGNVASNALNASSANIAGSGASSTSLIGAATQTVSATYGVLNAQENTGVVTAAVQNTFYGSSLNSAISGGADAVTGGTLSVSGNMVMAQATGNTGASSLTLTGLNNSTASAAIGSTQSNTGNVIASIASTSVGSSSYGSIGSSAITVGGNAISSSATGNSVTNLIRRN